MQLLGDIDFLRAVLHALAAADAVAGLAQRRDAAIFVIVVAFLEDAVLSLVVNMVVVHVLNVKIYY